MDVVLKVEGGCESPIAISGHSPVNIGRDGLVPELKGNRAVSREHCKLLYNAQQGFFVSPCKEPSRTILNDQSLEAGREYPFSPKDTLYVSGVPLKLVCRVRTKAEPVSLIAGEDVVLKGEAGISYIACEEGGRARLDSAYSAESVAALQHLHHAETEEWRLLSIDRNRVVVDGSRFVETRLIDGSSVEIAGCAYVFNQKERKLLAVQPCPGAELQLHKLTARYGAKAPVLGDINCRIPKGKITALIGQSGCGKTTLVKILAGLKEQTGGAIKVIGEDVEDYRKWASEELGYVSQFNAVHGELTVEQAVGYAAEIKSGNTCESMRESLVEGALAETSLLPCRGQFVDELSGGQQKRVNIACKITGHPRVLVLDEPTTGLDCATERQIIGVLHRMSRQGRTVVYVTHSVAAIQAADHVVVLERAEGGSVVAAEGAPGEVLRMRRRNSWEEVFDSLAGSEGEDKSSGTAPSPHPFHWFPVLLSRYLAIWLNSPVLSLVLLLGLPLALGIMIRLAVSLDDGQGGDRLIFAIVAMLWLSLNQSAREIVKERDIFLQESFAGVPIAAYLFSKCVFFFMVVLVQAALVAAPILWLDPNVFAPGQWLVERGVDVSFLRLKQLNIGFMYVWPTLLLAGFIGTSLGLLVSSLSLFMGKKGEVAAVLLAVLLTLPQILFSAKVMPDGKLSSPILPTTYYRAVPSADDAPVAQLMSYFTFSRYLYRPLNAFANNHTPADDGSIAKNAAIAISSVPIMLVFAWLLLNLYTEKARR